MPADMGEDMGLACRQADARASWSTLPFLPQTPTYNPRKTMPTLLQELARPKELAMKSSLEISIRAASWIGAQCMREFCAVRCIADERIETFIEYIESLASAEDLIAWDSRSSDLAITGLGDPLPPDLRHLADLAGLVESVREVSASQLYGKWQPQVVDLFLKSALDIAGLDVNQDRFSLVLDHDKGVDGWGSPIPEELLK